MKKLLFLILFLSSFVGFSQVKISDLPTESTLTDSTIIVVVKSSITKKSYLVDIQDFLNVVNIWSQSGTNTYITGQDVGIGTASPNFPLHVIGKIFADSILVDTLRFSGDNTIHLGDTVFLTDGDTLLLTQIVQESDTIDYSDTAMFAHNVDSANDNFYVKDTFFTDEIKAESGSNINFWYDVNLDDNSGGSPVLRLIDVSNKEIQIFKNNGGNAQINTTQNDMQITADGGDIQLIDDNLKTTGGIYADTYNSQSGVSAVFPEGLGTKDTLFIIDNSEADTCYIMDDGDTTRMVSENPIKIGNNSLIINIDGSLRTKEQFRWQIKPTNIADGTLSQSGMYVHPRADNVDFYIDFSGIPTKWGGGVVRLDSIVMKIYTADNGAYIDNSYLVTSDYDGTTTQAYSCSGDIGNGTSGLVSVNLLSEGIGYEDMAENIYFIRFDPVGQDLGDGTEIRFYGAIVYGHIE